jgi:putative NADH-flavin reductase
MNVVLYGATGMVGSRILQELILRGHQVKAVVRDASRVPTGPNATAETGDILDPGDVVRVVKGTDAVICAYSPGNDAANVVRLLDATHSVIAGMKQAGVIRLIMVGGAGSLFVAPGVTLIDSGHLPAEWLASPRHTVTLKRFCATPASIGRLSVQPPSSSRANGPANFVLERMIWWSTKPGPAASRPKISPSRWWTNWNIRSTSAVDSLSAIELDRLEARGLLVQRRPFRRPLFHEGVDALVEVVILLGARVPQG